MVVRTIPPPSVEPSDISDVAGAMGLEPGEVELFGRAKAKLDLGLLGRLSSRPDGKLVAVTAMTPTRSGEGKTTTAISLVDGLATIGERSLACLREPSVGPVLGAKGGGTGGGRAELVPMEDINLHFTGDLHAVAAANNLLASAVDAHLVHGNELGIDPATITWRRCLDIEDRLLRRIEIGVGEEPPFPRATGFDITAASEVMALLATARDLEDLRLRLGSITVAETFEEEPVTAEQLAVAGSMAVLLRDAVKPNLVQTGEGQPALVHCGPFANIAHGNNSLVADLVGLKLADFVVTESGFGADLGFEKLMHIVCRGGGIAPTVVVLVATTKAMKRAGGDEQGDLVALERGAANLAAHLRIVETFGLKAVVAVNRFAGDSADELHAMRMLALEHGAFAAEINNGFNRGGAGADELAEVVAEAAARDVSPRFLYDLDDAPEDKITTLAQQVYGADGVQFSALAAAQLTRLTPEARRLPVCMAKTHLSLSHDPDQAGVPHDFVLPVRELRPYTGAGWVVAVCGETQTMPGLPAGSAAERIDLTADGHIVGLS